MGQIKIAKDSLEYESYPAGEYFVQCNGFKPAFSKDKKSYNMRPILRITGHATLDGKTVLTYLNSGATFILRDFTHAFGLLLDGETPDQAALGEAGDFNFPPGEFLNFDPQKPESWQYVGPLLGRTARVELALTQSMKKDSAGVLQPVPNTFRNEIKRFFCAVPGCSVAHKESLIR